MEYNFSVNQVNMLIEQCESAIKNLDSRIATERNPLSKAGFVNRRANWIAIKGELLMSSVRHNRSVQS